MQKHTYAVILSLTGITILLTVLFILPPFIMGSNISTQTEIPSNGPSAVQEPTTINLLDPVYNWSSINHANLEQNGSILYIKTITKDTDGKLFNRAVLNINSSLSEISKRSDLPLSLSLQYASRSFEGNATFFTEIRSTNSSEILWGSPLLYTDGKTLDQTFVLPNSIAKIPIEIRLYIVSNGAGNHELIITKATIAY